MKLLLSIFPESKIYKGATAKINYLNQQVAEFNGGWVRRPNSRRVYGCSKERKRRK